MTHPHLTRAHLEAMLVGLAALRPEIAPELYGFVDVEHISPAARALLEAILDEPALAWQCLPTLATTAGQCALAERAYAMPAKELTFWQPRTLVQLVNQLPSTASTRVSVMDVGAETAA